MATIKSYTSLEQSKVLAEILPFDSADMRWIRIFNDNKPSDWKAELGKPIKSCDDTPCWSLAALLNILPDTINGTYCQLTIDKEGDAYNISYDDILSKEAVILYAEYSLIDACVEMIEKLHEQKVL